MIHTRNRPWGKEGSRQSGYQVTWAQLATCHMVAIGILIIRSKKSKERFGFPKVRDQARFLLLESVPGTGCWSSEPNHTQQLSGRCFLFVLSRLTIFGREKMKVPFWGVTHA